MSRVCHSYIVLSYFDFDGGFCVKGETKLSLSRGTLLLGIKDRRK
jgi:hypothetical protein